MSSYQVGVLIADDEEPARNRLRVLLAEDKRFLIVAEAENGDEVLKMITENTPEVAFLDINMPGASIFTSIPALKNPPLIVFQTAYSEYGVRAFDIDAVDYLLKPISQERINKSLDKLIHILGRDQHVEDSHGKNETKDYISAKSGGVIRILKVDKIERISFEQGFCFIYANKERLFSERTLSSFEKMLFGNSFYRISRTDLINLEYLNKLHPMFKGQYIVEMKNGSRINISRRRIQGLKDLLNLK